MIKIIIYSAVLAEILKIAVFRRRKKNFRCFEKKLKNLIFEKKMKLRFIEV
jgi:hypothetical protein